MNTILMRALLCVCAMIQMPARVAACDVCGAAANTGYYGILPQYRQHFAGVRYQTAAFTSRHLPSLFENDALTSADRLHKAELWGRFYPSKRWQLFVFIPYQVSARNENNTRTISHGAGDLSLSGNYIFLNTGDSGNTKTKHFLSAGAGLKIPTGKYDPASPAGLRSGTGSWDLLFNLIYTLRYKRTGINTDLNARINTANHSEYSFGNTYAGGVRFFYWYSYRNFSFLPHTGILAEHTEKDLDNGFVQKFSGGSGLYASTGIDLYSGKIGLGSSFTLPLSEHLYEGLVKTTSRISFHVIYLF